MQWFASVADVNFVLIKVLERPAFQVKGADVDRFMNEINSLKWCTDNLVFLDEVCFDNRDMWRTHGYGTVGKP